MILIFKKKTVQLFLMLLYSNSLHCDILQTWAGGYHVAKLIPSASSSRADLALFSLDPPTRESLYLTQYEPNINQNLKFALLASTAN